MGFEPTCPVKDNCISSAARYDRFDNSPCHICNISLKKTSGKRRELMERTKVNSVVNNTAKVPKNQGFWRSGSKAVTRFRVQLVMTASITLPVISAASAPKQLRKRLQLPMDFHPPPLFYSIPTIFASPKTVFLQKGCKMSPKRVKSCL